MIDATSLNAHCTTCSLRAKMRGVAARSVEQEHSRKNRNCLGDRFAREWNTKLHAVTDAKDQPIRLFMSAGEVRDHTGAAALLDSLPQVDWLPADRVTFPPTFIQG